MTDLERSMLAAIASGATVAEVATEFGADVDAVRALAGEPEPPGAPAKAARTRRAAKPLSPIERRAIAIAKALPSLDCVAWHARQHGGPHTRNHGYGCATIVGGVLTRRI